MLYSLACSPALWHCSVVANSVIFSFTRARGQVLNGWFRRDDVIAETAEAFAKKGDNEPVLIEGCVDEVKGEVNAALARIKELNSRTWNCTPVHLLRALCRLDVAAAAPCIY